MYGKGFCLSAINLNVDFYIDLYIHIILYGIYLRFRIKVNLFFVWQTLKKTQVAKTSVCQKSNFFFFLRLKLYLLFISVSSTFPALYRLLNAFFSNTFSTGESLHTRDGSTL